MGAHDEDLCGRSSPAKRPDFGQAAYLGLAHRVQSVRGQEGRQGPDVSGVIMSEAQKSIAYKSPLDEMTHPPPTCLWNDSAAHAELSYSIEHGGVGATCNPVIVLDVIKKEAQLWNDRIRAIAREMPTATEEEVGWKLVEEISAKRSELLLPVFAKHQGRNGRLSIQTDPHYYRSTEALLQQAIRFNALAPNMIVKIPATQAGIAAIEEATYHGISINATVSFSLPQSIAVAEAVERGLQRREKEGKDI